MTEPASTGKARERPRAKARVTLPQVFSAFILVMAVAHGVGEICAGAVELLLGPGNERAVIWAEGLGMLVLALIGFKVAHRIWEAPRYGFLLRPKPGSLVFAFRWWSAGWRLLGLALLCSLGGGVAAALAVRGLDWPEGPTGDILYGALRILFLAVLILAVLGITARLLRGAQVVPQP